MIEEPIEPSFDTSSENLTEEPTDDPSEVSSEESTEEPSETCTEMITEVMTEEDTEVFTDAVTEPSTQSCSHSFDDWKTVSSASCTSPGKRTRACLLCGEEETEPLAPLGHDEVTHEGQAATCTEGGYEAYVTCTRCDYTTYQTLPALGHQEVVSPAVPPAHGTPRLTEGAHCAYCGLVFIEQQPLPPLYALNVVASPDKYGQVSSSQLIGEGREVTLEAQAEEGYYFFGWLDGNTLISRETKLTITMGAEDCTVTAFFTATEPVSKSVWNGDVAQSFSRGTGTANDPYMISHGAELAYLAELARNGQANKYYELANDIDLGGLEWMPSGRFLDGFEYRCLEQYQVDPLDCRTRCGKPRTCEPLRGVW